MVRDLSIDPLPRTRIKICGIRHPDDARAAADAGADAIGMIFHPPSKRNISLSVARSILDALPAFVTPVGLFVDADPDAILQVTRELHLRHVQLHGHETPHDVAALKGLVVIKAIRVDPDHFSKTLKTWRDAISTGIVGHLRGIVLETATHDKQAGGTGIANDWSAVIAHLEAGEFNGLPSVIAAGGLRPESVEEVVRGVRPWAVDVSSGVEETPGRKSVRLIEEFVRAVRKADAA